MNDISFYTSDGTAFPAGGPAWRAPDGTPFSLAQSISDVVGAEIPLVSLGESPTPVLPTHLAGRLVDLKLDFRLPSGSFKDRGAQMVVSVLRHLGVSSVVEDSSGNSGAALATYAAAAGIGCTIVIPRSSRGPVAKQIARTGARLVRVPGPRIRASETAWRLAGELYYASHIYNPIFYAGISRMADELVSQDAVPNTIVLPVGSGTLLLGLYHGFRRHGLQPRLVAAQIAGTQPVVTEFRERSAAGASERGPDNPRTRSRSDARMAARVAPGIATAHPARLHEIVDAILQTAGHACSVEPDAVMRAQEVLAGRGIYVESTSAVAVAATESLVTDGWFGPDERVMIVLTGHGLKR